MRSSSSERLPARAVVVAGLLAALGVAHGQTAGDAKAGASVFASECGECHSLRPGKNKKGPTLYAIVGRRAAEVPDAKYSDAMRRSGWTWDDNTLRRYIAEPRAALPGGSMKYDGLADRKALEDLLAYLAATR